ncbi:MAG: FAD-dependent oxidoreductase [Bacteroidia bacterium]|nr:FAD-dependent oxidoreductase [Bacteroidia bacterium]
MFAALKLQEEGVTPIVIERGKRVRERRRDLIDIYRKRFVHSDSNYCFGEGGAGTFSDGKLYTRSKKRGEIRQVLKSFVEHGAKPEILFEAHPHIGTNKLPGIVENIRETIEEQGGDVRFDTRLTGFIVRDGKVKGVRTTKGEVLADAVILATGHSARDVFELLNNENIAIEAKPFALGVRIEHPQAMIDRIQYKCKQRGEFLPPASYSLVNQVEGRGVFSFCMCPGGIIAPSMTQNGEVVVNGWSPSKRNGEFANSGFVVEVRPEDWKEYGENNPLAALEFQADVEKRAFVAAGEDLKAPGQRVGDFVRSRVSDRLVETSYLPGVESVDLRTVLPDFVHKRIRQAIIHFGKRMRGYNSNDGMLVGVESRTSSPVRIPRDRDTLQHPEVQGLYPCGEGAGYAGGIMSAALDGIACAQRIAAQDS